MFSVMELLRSLTLESSTRMGTLWPKAIAREHGCLKTANTPRDPLKLPQPIRSNLRLVLMWLSPFGALAKNHLDHGWLVIFLKRRLGFAARCLEWLRPSVSSQVRIGCAFSSGQSDRVPQMKAQPNRRSAFTEGHSHSTHRAAKPKLSFLFSAKGPVF